MNAQLMFRRVTAVLAAVVVVGAAATASVSADTASSTGRLSSANIRVYDFTTYDLRFAQTDWGLPNPTDPDAIITARPTGGATAPPGDYHEVSIKPNIKMHAVQLRYESAQPSGRGVTVAIITDDDSSNNRSTVECTGSGYTCVTDGKDSIYLLDDVANYPATAVRDVPATDAQTQFDMLRTLCTATSGVQCEYRVGGKMNTLSDPHRVTPVVYSDVPWVFARELTVTSEATSSITSGTEVGIAYEEMSASVAREYGTSTTKSHSYTENTTYNVPAGVYFWVQASAPVTRYTGDFKFSLKGAGVVYLRDVYYDVPDPGRPGRMDQVNSPVPPLSTPIEHP